MLRANNGGCVAARDRVGAPVAPIHRCRAVDGDTEVRRKPPIFQTNVNARLAVVRDVHLSHVQLAVVRDIGFSVRKRPIPPLRRQPRVRRIVRQCREIGKIGCGVAFDDGAVVVIKVDVVLARSAATAAGHVDRHGAVRLARGRVVGSVCGHGQRLHRHAAAAWNALYRRRKVCAVTSGRECAPLTADRRVRAGNIAVDACDFR